MFRPLRADLNLMGDMRQALETGAIYLLHQPKYNFRSGAIDSAECLVRWRHPVRGDVAPDLFIPAAEETGHIRALTEWVLERAIDDQKTLGQAGRPLQLAINISPRLLSDPDFAGRAAALAREAPHQLCFEITETAIIDNHDVALESIALFAASGVRMAIDDYGAGLSSLYLKQLPAHELKIDKQLTQDIMLSEQHEREVRSTIELAHGLGMVVTAEGVETSEAFSLLARMGCDLAQGNFIAHPAPVEQLLDLLNNEQRLSSYREAAPPPPQRD